MHSNKRFLIMVVVIAIVSGGKSFYAAVAADGRDLISEYSASLGFANHQVLEVVFADTTTMKVVVDECSFCGAFKDEDSRNRIARSTLAWFLSKTGGTTGTVEWYNRSRVKIMTIAGSAEKSEIAYGPPCAINKQ